MQAICSSNYVITDAVNNHHPVVKDKEEELPPLKVLEAKKKEIEGSIKEADSKLKELYNEIARVKGEMARHCASLQDTQKMINRHNEIGKGQEHRKTSKAEEMKKMDAGEHAKKIEVHSKQDDNSHKNKEKSSAKKDKEKEKPTEKTAGTHVTKQKERDVPDKVRYELKFYICYFLKPTYITKNNLQRSCKITFICPFLHENLCFLKHSSIIHFQKKRKEEDEKPSSSKQAEEKKTADKPNEMSEFSKMLNLQIERQPRSKKKPQPQPAAAQENTSSSQSNPASFILKTSVSNLQSPFFAIKPSVFTIPLRKRPHEVSGNNVPDWTAKNAATSSAGHAFAQHSLSPGKIDKSPRLLPQVLKQMPNKSPVHNQNQPFNKPAPALPISKLSELQKNEPLNAELFSPTAASDEVTDETELDSSKDLRDVFGNFIIEVNADATGHFEYKSRKRLEDHESDQTSSASATSNPRPGPKGPPEIITIDDDDEVEQEQGQGKLTAEARTKETAEAFKNAMLLMGGEAAHVQTVKAANDDSEMGAESHRQEQPVEQEQEQEQMDTSGAVQRNQEADRMTVLNFVTARQNRQMAENRDNDMQFDDDDPGLITVDDEEEQQKRDREGGEEQVPEGYTTMQLDNGDVMAIPLPADQPLPPVPQYHHPVADALADRLTSAFAQGPIELVPFVNPDQQEERIDRKPFIIKRPRAASEQWQLINVSNLPPVDLSDNYCRYAELYPDQRGIRFHGPSQSLLQDIRNGCLRHVRGKKKQILRISTEPLEEYDDNHPVIIDERNEYEKQEDLSREQQESQAAVALRKNLLVDVIDRKNAFLAFLNFCLHPLPIHEPPSCYGNDDIINEWPHLQLRNQMKANRSHHRYWIEEERLFSIQEEAHVSLVKEFGLLSEDSFLFPFPRTAGFWWPVVIPHDGVNPADNSTDVKNFFNSGGTFNMFVSQTSSSAAVEKDLLISHDPDYHRRRVERARRMSKGERMAKGRFRDRICYKRKFPKETIEQARENERKQEEERRIRYSKLREEHLRHSEMDRGMRTRLMDGGEQPGTSAATAHLNARARGGLVGSDCMPTVNMDEKNMYKKPDVNTDWNRALGDNVHDYYTKSSDVSTVGTRADSILPSAWHITTNRTSLGSLANRSHHFIQSLNGMNEPICDIWKQIREQFKFGERNEDREELRKAVLDKMQKPAIAAAILHQMCELPYQKENRDAEMRHGLLSKSEAADADERNKEIEAILLRSQYEGIPVDFERLTALCEIRAWEWKHWPVIWDALATNFRVIPPVSQMIYARMRKEDGTVDDKMPLKEAINTAFTEVVKPEQRVARTQRMKTCEREYSKEAENQKSSIEVHLKKQREEERRIREKARRNRHEERQILNEQRHNLGRNHSRSRSRSRGPSGSRSQSQSQSHSHSQFHSHSQSHSYSRSRSRSRVSPDRSLHKPAFSPSSSSNNPSGSCTRLRATRTSSAENHLPPSEELILLDEE
ncbi:hypothetical protein WR25_12646 isoform A [Diploscapter pachys]|uniref:Uncharacterized protein n=1 Tax=Diploscapter pachys TaxID=2018661 RepID=A0A2A2L3B9_9BILA|nr:hypothetical protein WR25_12646 isoform A [Diploscapter pachys]